MMIEILMSTMNRQSINELNLESKNIFRDCLIINQVTDENLELINEEIKDKNIRMLSFLEKGLSKSRNRAIENAKGDICLIADDDIIYKKNYIEIIKKAYLDNPEFDIVTFQIETLSGKEYKNYKKKKFIYNKLSVFKVSSIEISFILNKIKDKNIYFDKTFGLGTTFNSGEENIFLMECLENRLKIGYFPYRIVKHPFESSGKKINLNILITKGALFYRCFKKIYLIFDLVFIIKKRQVLKKEKISIIKAIIYFIKGKNEYIKLCKEIN